MKKAIIQFLSLLFLTSLPGLGVPAQAAPDDGGGDWPTWGRDATRNMVSPAKGISLDFKPGDIGPDGKPIDTEGLKWYAELGSQAYGSATVHGGKVFVGTNNEKPRDPNVTGDHSVVMCFDEKTGEFLWQLAAPKLDAGKINDWEYLGICSSVAVEGKYGYVVTNRCEVLCLDLEGMADGNDGPFQDEGKYVVGGLEKVNTVEAQELDKKTADIVWGFDMRTELGVFPHNISSNTVTITDKYIWVATSNGVDWSHLNIPSPQAPTFIALDKKTGQLVGEEAEDISPHTLHCNWSTSSHGMIAGKDTVVFGGGDGIVYGFDANEFTTEKDGDDEFQLLKALWKVDVCPKEYRFDENGEPIKYATYPGPSEMISSPVIYNDKVYAVIGQDPEHGEGVGAITCIDPSKGTGQDAIVWQFKEISRSISTPSIVDGLVYAADYSGRVFCLDAETGEKYWMYDTLSHIWSSTLYLDGKILIANEDGELVALKAGKEMEEIKTISFPSPIYASCLVANGTLYVMTQTHLYAFGQP